MYRGRMADDEAPSREDYEKLKRENEALKARIRELEGLVRKLASKLRMDSSNSSLPPSLDTDAHFVSGLRGGQKNTACQRKRNHQQAGQHRLGVEPEAFPLDAQALHDRPGGFQPLAQALPHPGLEHAVEPPLPLDAEGFLQGLVEDVAGDEAPGR